VLHLWDNKWRKKLAGIETQSLTIKLTCFYSKYEKHLHNIYLLSLLFCEIRNMTGRYCEFYSYIYIKPLWRLNKYDKLMLLVRRIRAKYNVTYGSTTEQSFFESEGGKWGAPQRKCLVAFSLGMCCVTLSSDTVRWTLEHLHVVEIKVNLLLHLMNVYEGEWSV
jgi:hypothetical protein